MARQLLALTATAIVWLLLPATAGATLGSWTQIYTQTTSTQTGNDLKAVSPLNVPESGAIQSVQVAFRVSGPDLSGASATLTAPDGTSATVFSTGDAGFEQTDIGSGTGCSAPAVFTDTAPTHLYEGSPPYVGPFKPDDPFSGLNDAEDSAGRWTLTLNDDVSADDTIVCWQLTITQRADVARQGELEAALSYHYDPDADIDRIFANVRLRIARGAQTLYSAPLKKACSSCVVQPAGFNKRSSVELRDLNADGNPEALVWLYWGGAHCCDYVNVFRISDSAAQLTSHVFGDFGAKLEQLQGQALFVSADDSFAYAFTDFADSWAPVQVWSFTSAGRFVDTTRNYRSLVAADAAKIWRGYLQRGANRDPRGVLAAWAADEALLGHAASAKAKLDTLARQGKLWTSALPSEPAGAAYIAKLWRFLARQGYLRAG